MTSRQNGQDALAALEAAMSDGSWLTSVLIERLRACLQAKRLAPETSDLDALTARERQILGLICEGRSDIEMSDILHLSQNTVRNHVASLYRKIGVNRRGAAIIWARERAITSKEVLSARVREPSQHGGARK
jgi:DNA-binding NarL/FixJ family response regulator